MKPGTILSAVFLLLAATAYSQSAWTALPPMPHHAGFIGSAVYDGQIYLFGGAPTITSATDRVYLYDPANNTFAPLPPLAVPTCGAGVVELNGKIYVIGGGDAPTGNYYKTVRVFDPLTRTWSSAADMPYARSLFAIGVIDGKIYVAGGGDQTGHILSSTLSFDPVTNLWSNEPAMAVARAFTAGAWVKDRFYALGGLDGPAGVGLDAFEAFDLANDWTVAQPLPTGRWVLAAAAVSGRIFAFGGSAWNGDVPLPELATAEMFDPETGHWLTLPPMPTSRRALTAAVVGHYVYTFGGIQGFQGTGAALGVVERFDTDGLLLLLAAHEPAAGWLAPNVPNPFSGSTALRFALGESGDVQLQIFDLRGRPVHTALQQFLPAGEHHVTLPAGTLPPGTYVARLIVDRVPRGTVRLVAVQ